MNIFRRYAASLRDELPLDYSETVVALVDALREYIRTDEAITRDLLQENAITPEDVARVKPHMDRCRELLRELEEVEINPSLWGMKK